jgi:hypothetical protein
MSTYLATKYSMKPYLTVPLTLSKYTFEWLKDFCRMPVHDFQVKGPDISALINLTEVQQTRLMQSQAWSEINEFVKGYGIHDAFPQLFIYKSLRQPRSVALGNPHLDTYGAGGVEKEAPIRFNILLDGDDDTEMVWWDIDWKNPKVEVIIFKNASLGDVGRIQAVGDKLEDQWKNLGEPAVRANNLTKIQEHASFVRTDRLHALNWTGNKPRLILSIRSCQPWDSIIA